MVALSRIAGRQSRAPFSRRANISGRTSTSERIGQKPETTAPGSMSISPAASAILSEASIRHCGSSASRRASASERSFFLMSLGTAVMPPSLEQHAQKCQMGG
jgi:hypothetical protein